MIKPVLVLVRERSQQLIGDIAIRTEIDLIAIEFSTSTHGKFPYKVSLGDTEQ